MSERRSMYYVDGSTVRMMPVPEKRQANRQSTAAPNRNPNRPKNPNPNRTGSEKRQPKPVPKSAQRALAFNFGYTLYVIMAVAIMVAASFIMLGMESRLNEKKQNIANLETELEAIKDENTAYRVQLENMYTLDQVYDIATNELGMVYAKKGQIVYYDSANEDYVKQYQDVPAAD
jgi:cell division protein FtsL